jgi:hypothetical protein
LTTREDFIKSPLDFPSEIDTHNTICIDPISREGDTKRSKSKGAVVQVSVKDACAYVKMGWTFNNRNDAAIIVSPDNKAHYILVVFGDEKKFYQDKEFFPILSRQVYNQMLKK